MAKEVSSLEREAIALTKREVTAWEQSHVFVTEKVAFAMRNLIRQCRKNYWGVFDEPIDPTTGRKKIWVPLTESVTESAVKNIDLDTKDINFRAKHAGAVGYTHLVRSAVKHELDEMYFGEHLDQLLRNVAIDGTAVWKTFEQKEEGKYCVKIRPVDLLNFYTDPTAPTLHESSANIERALIPVSDFMKMSEWKNKEKASVTKSTARVDEMFNANNTDVTGETPFVEVWERWGLTPKSLITGDLKDKDTYVEAQIVISSLLKNPVVHFIKENKDCRPYEEAWYSRIANRWYGRGIAEKLLMMQTWMNTVVNIRINRSYVQQLGIFKIRRGSGVTPQMLSRLAANGAVQVDDMKDLEQLVVQEASMASYKDEDVIQTWAARVTSAFEVVTGEALPASTTATAVAQQSSTARSEFELIKEGIGMFLQRWINDHVLPIVEKNLKPDHVLRLTGNPDELRALDEQIVNKMLYAEVQKMIGEGKFIDPNSLQFAQQSAIQKFQAMGKDRYVPIDEGIDADDYTAEVYITNEEFDKGVMVQNLLTVLQMAPEIKDQTLKHIFDLMGLDPVSFAPALPQAVAPTGTPNETPQEQTTAANVAQANGTAR